MTGAIHSIKESVLQLIFPHVCEGCGTDRVQHDQFLCFRCLSDLPHTSYHMHSNNPVEKIFWGRIPVVSATAHYYFTKQSVIQQLMHEIKYRGNTDLGIYLGKLMGADLASSNRFAYADALIPLPLFAEKEKKRGYNQAKLLCDGIALVLQKPVISNAVYRAIHTETQTKKNRVQRWQNIEKGFALSNPDLIEGKHVILVDDVITTGATLESCGRILLQCEDLRLSIASLCFSSGF